MASKSGFSSTVSADPRISPFTVLEKKQSVLLPPGVGNSFCVLSDYTIFMYKWAYSGEYHDVDKQFTIKWDDPKLNINWPIENPILSERDK